MIIQVAQSNAAPHLVSTVGQAFVRRGASSVPMGLRDLQSAFWDARTRGEWVHSERKRANQEAFSFIDSFEIQFRHFFGQLVPPDFQPTIVRISAIPQRQLQGHRTAKAFLDAGVEHLLRPEIRYFDLTYPAAFGTHSFSRLLTPRAHGVRGIDTNGTSIMDLMDTGACHSFGLVYSPRKSEGNNKIAPAWLLHPICNAMLLADIFKRASEDPGIPIEIDLSIRFGPETVGWCQSDGFGAYSTIPPAREADIGPFTWTQRVEMPSVFAEIEYQLYAAFGHLVSKPATVNFDKAFASVEQQIQTALIKSRAR